MIFQACKNLYRVHGVMLFPEKFDKFEYLETRKRNDKPNDY